MPFLGTKPAGHIPRLNRSHPHAQGLTAFYVFHEGGGNVVTDLVSGKTGTFVNSPTWVADRHGQGGYALNFVAASNQYVDLGTPTELDMNATGAMAVCASYYTPTKPNFTNFVIASKGSQWTLDVEGPSSSGRLYVNNGGAGGLWSEGRSALDGDTRVIGGSFRTSDGFGYIAGNGKLASSSTAPFAQLPSSATTTRIGVNGSGTAGFGGHIGFVAIWNRFVSSTLMEDFQRDPFASVVLQPGRLARLHVAASTGTTGTIAVTEADDTASASGTSVLNITGTIAVTEASDTSAGTGTSSITGSIAVTEADDTSSGSGTETITGTIAATESSDTASASGTSVVNATGTIAVTEVGDTLSATGTETITGTIAVTESDDTCSATGVFGDAVSGSIAVTETDDTVSASGLAGIRGSIAINEDDDTASASGLLSISGSSATTEEADTASASGLLLIVGGLSVTESDDTSSASGSVNTDVSGTIAVTEADDVMSASGSGGESNITDNYIIRARRRGRR